MSYCRWSSDDYQCDVYVYRSDRGYETNVAGRKRVIPADVLAALPTVTEGDVASWFARYQALSAWMDCTPPVWRKLPEPAAGGHHFIDATPEACSDRLEALRAEGFNVPQSAIDELRSEAAGCYDDCPPGHCACDDGYARTVKREVDPCA